MIRGSAVDSAEILIADRENLIAQAELLISGCIEFDDYGFHITKKGYETAFHQLKELPLAKRALICLFFANLDCIY
ncbi:hypothetical protein ACFLT6_00065 [Chloroflexota bacterium]